MNGVFWVGICLGGLASLIAAELTDLASWTAPRVVRGAARRLRTPELIERYSEEWQAELNAYEGLKLIKLFKALSIYAASAKLRREIHGTAGTWKHVGLVLSLIIDAFRIALKGSAYRGSRTVGAHVVPFFCFRAGVLPTLLMLENINIVDGKIFCPQQPRQKRVFTTLVHRPLGIVLLPTLCIIYAIRHRISPSEFFEAWRAQGNLAGSATKLIRAAQAAHGSAQGLAVLQDLIAHLRDGWDDIVAALSTRSPTK